jgi:hypothetical protein
MEFINGDKQMYHRGKQGKIYFPVSNREAKFKVVSNKEFSLAHVVPSSVPSL